MVMTLARTLDPAAHALRRDEFVDAAQRLMRTKGYEQVSIQDVLDELGTSRGAFYHYFDSKAALLDAIVERMVDEGVARYAHRVADPDSSALDKLEGFFADIAQYKAEHRDLILGAFESWMSDDNAAVREHFRTGLVRRLVPLLTGIVRQGVAEGVFDVRSPEGTARVLVSLLQGANENASSLFFARQSREIGLEEVEERLMAYPDAFERVLGAAPGTIHITNRSTIREWFALTTDQKGTP